MMYRQRTDLLRIPPKYTSKQRFQQRRIC